MKLTKEQSAAALEIFTAYFVQNYPGPNTIIRDPNWHAPKIFKAALYAIELERERAARKKWLMNCGLHTGLVKVDD
jgi:hypothetical protein